MEHRVRMLATGPKELAQELHAIGVTEYGVSHMAPRGRMIVLRIENVSGKAANLMKQHMLSAGGDVAVGKQVAAFDDTPAPVVAMGTPEQFQKMLATLAMQPFGLREIGKEMAEVIAHLDQPPAPVTCGEYALSFERSTVLMGIINVTPDSFSGDGLGDDKEAAIEQARRFVQAGADIVDIGGESTRPGAQQVSVEEELALVKEPVETISSELGVPVSIDTSKSEVAAEAIEAGATFVNDVYGLRKPGMIDVVADTGVGVCIMHMLGDPETMQDEPTYEDVITDIYDFLVDRVQAAVDGGIEETQIVIDPGFGFGKTVAHNLEIVRRLEEFRSMGRPVLLGVSRKSTIGHVLDIPQPQERLWGTAALNALAIANGADIIRVHDVEQMVQVAKMTDAALYGPEDDE